MRLLVTGARGLLGAAIVREFTAAGWEVIPLDRAALDVTDGRAVARQVAAARPDLVVNCVAYNDVDGAEKDAVTALQVNALAVRSLARGGERGGRRASCTTAPISCSTARATRPYIEEDRAEPAQRLRAPRSCSASGSRWIHRGAYVLRVESLFGEPAAGRQPQGSLKGILVQLRAGEPLPVFVDRTVSPGYTTDIAAATRALVERRAAGRLSLRQCRARRAGRTSRRKRPGCSACRST